MNARENEAAGEAAGARGSPATESPTQIKELICKYTKQLIDDMRSDMYLAVRIEEFLDILSGRINVELEEQGKKPIKIDDRIVMECLYRDKRVEVHRYVNTYILWLWNEEMEVLKSMILNDAYKYRAVLTATEASFKESEDQSAIAEGI